MEITRAWGVPLSFLKAGSWDLLDEQDLDVVKIYWNLGIYGDYTPHGKTIVYSDNYP